MVWWAVFVCGLCGARPGVPRDDVSSSSKVQNGAPQTADGGTVARQTWSETDRVRTALHNNKHGPPGSWSSCLSRFPQVLLSSLDLCWAVSDRQAPETARYSQVALN